MGRDGGSREEMGSERNEETQAIGKINREGDGGEVVSLAQHQVIETELIRVHERVHQVEVDEKIAGIVANTCTRERGPVLYQEGMDEEPNEQGTASEQGISG